MISDNRKILNPFRNRGLLTDRLRIPINEISSAIHDYNKLHYQYYQYNKSEHGSQPVIKSDFNLIKKYFRNLKNNIVFVEFIYSLQALKKIIKRINKDLIKYDEIEEYQKEFKVINNYLIEFIDRFTNVCLNHRYTELLEYQKKINLEAFIDLTTKKEKKEVLIKWLDLIKFQLDFDNGKNILFDNFDKHQYSSSLNLIGIKDKQEIFQNELKKLIDIESLNNSKSKEYKHKKLLTDFIFNVNDKDLFIEELIKTFKTEIGINLKIVIEILKDENIILIKSREFKPFYTSLKEKFNRDIGSYTALNDLYKHSKDNKVFYNKDIEQILIKLNPLLNKHKTN